MTQSSQPQKESYDYRRFQLLFVHERPETLTYFRKLFEQDFNILTAASAMEALEICESKLEHIGVVMADQDLTNTTGATLLMQIAKRIPHAQSILSLKYTNALAIYGVPCEHTIYRFVIKPWDIPQLHTTLLRAMEFHIIRHERDALLHSQKSIPHITLARQKAQAVATLENRTRSV